MIRNTIVNWASSLLLSDEQSKTKHDEKWPWLMKKYKLWDNMEGILEI